MSDVKPGNGEIREHVKGVVAQVLCMEPQEIEDAELLSSYGLNSIDLIDVVVKLEETYKIKFVPETMKLVSCRVLADNIQDRLLAGQ